jgi:probable phosphoglycerate mutase
MTTRLYLIRHGQTAHSAADRFSGASDVDLAEEGQRQATCLAQRLAGEPITAFYCSPLRRAIETAGLIAHPHGLTPTPVAGLREIDYGLWEGLPREEVLAQFGDEYAAWEGDPLTLAPRDGETGLAVLARMLPALRDIARHHAGQRVAVVAHKSANRLALCGLLGLDPRTYRDRLDQSPACLNIVDFADNGQARLVLFNDVSHYQ